MKFIASSLLALWCSTTVNAFAFTGSSTFTAKSPTVLFETVEDTEAVNTLFKSATIYGSKVADEKIRYVNLSLVLTVLDGYILYVFACTVYASIQLYKYMRMYIPIVLCF